MSYSIDAGHLILISQTARSKLPNIVYMYADDLGYGDLGCYGREKLSTNIDMPAKSRMRYSDPAAILNDEQ